MQTLVRDAEASARQLRCEQERQRRVVARRKVWPQRWHCQTQGLVGGGGEGGIDLGMGDVGRGVRRVRFGAMLWFGGCLVMGDGPRCWVVDCMVWKGSLLMGYIMVVDEAVDDIV